MNISSLLLPLASLFAVAAFGCGSDSDSRGETITPTESQTSCTAATDCTPVFVGDSCSACICPNAAVRADARDAYQASFDTEREACGADPGAACAADCAPATAVCTEGKCALAK